MPELPEVETVVRQLRPIATGQHIRRLEVVDRKLTVWGRRQLSKAAIRTVFRSGKQIVLALLAESAPGGRLWLAFHLRMSGRLIWVPTGRDHDSKHLRARLVIDGGSIWFVDTRRFGSIRTHSRREELRPAGLDPMDDAFTAKRLAELLRCSRQAVKVWLLRQDRLVGLGNIYASEILFAARIHPARMSTSLSRMEVRRLHAATGRILRAAIASGGTTFSDFRDTRNNSGAYRDELQVYGRSGEPCRRCGGKVLKWPQQGRSTYHCPTCQPRHAERRVTDRPNL